MISELRLLERIRDEIRPKLELSSPEEDGYNCCGCSTYEQIVEDIEAIIRDETSKGFADAHVPT